MNVNNKNIPHLLHIVGEKQFYSDFVSQSLIFLYLF